MYFYDKNSKINVSMVWAWLGVWFSVSGNCSRKVGIYAIPATSLNTIQSPIVVSQLKVQLLLLTIKIYKYIL